MNTAALSTPSPKGVSYPRLIAGLIFLYFVTIPLFWLLEDKDILSQPTAALSITLLQIGIYVLILAAPWLKLPGQERLNSSQKFDKMIIAWIFICLSPRFLWELPWVLFFEQIKEGVLHNSIYTYAWSPMLIGGDVRYFNRDPLVLTLELIALFVGIFEAWALYRFFVQGYRFTTTQISYIMAGMVVEVFMPAVYFGIAAVAQIGTSANMADFLIKFILLNSFWCILPILTFAWGVRKLSTQSLQLDY